MFHSWWAHYNFICLFFLLQRRMGGPLRGRGRVRAGSRGRNHDEAAVRGGQVFRWLLPEAAAGHQHEKPLVRWVLAVPLPVPAARSPTGEQELQESLHRWVIYLFIFFNKLVKTNLKTYWFLSLPLLSCCTLDNFILLNTKNLRYKPCLFCLYALLVITFLSPQKVNVVNCILDFFKIIKSLLKMTHHKSNTWLIKNIQYFSKHDN